eukprot:3660923-Rhodomonas_salina.1
MLCMAKAVKHRRACGHAVAIRNLDVRVLVTVLPCGQKPACPRSLNLHEFLVVCCSGNHGLQRGCPQLPALHGEVSSGRTSHTVYTSYMLPHLLP